MQPVFVVHLFLLLVLTRSCHSDALTKFKPKNVSTKDRNNRYYSLLTLVMLVIFESTVVKRRMKSLEDVRAMRMKPYAVQVHASCMRVCVCVCVCVCV